VTIIAPADFYFSHDLGRRSCFHSDPEGATLFDAFASCVWILKLSLDALAASDGIVLFSQSQTAMYLQNAFPTLPSTQIETLRKDAKKHREVVRGYSSELRPYVLTELCKSIQQAPTHSSKELATVAPQQNQQKHALPRTSWRESIKSASRPTFKKFGGFVIGMTQRSLNAMLDQREKRGATRMRDAAGLILCTFAAAMAPNGPWSFQLQALAGGGATQKPHLCGA